MADGRRSRQKQLATSGGVLKRPLTDFDDIVFEILSRLPVKSLLRLRCVCKSWRALISESHFVTKHLNHAVRGIDSNSFSRLFVAHDIFLSIDYESMKDGYLHDSAATEHDFAVMFPHLSINLVLGSCNGLVCLELVQESQLGFVPESQLLYDIVLWNPCTRVSKVLPRPTFDWNSDCLVFYGFGFDSTTDDYKVVWGTSYKSTEVTIIRVFSLKTGSWRTHQGLDYVPLNGRSCLLNGALHWLEHQWVEGELSAVGLRIVSFDLAEEKLQEIMPLPCHPANRKHVIMGVGTSRNCLFVYSNPESDDIDESLNTYFRLWVMKEYGVKESWTEVLKLPSEILPNEDESCLLPLCILENGRVMFDHDGNSLELYNPEDKTFCTIVQAREDWCLKAAVYVETLVSPVTGSGTDI